MQRNTDHRRATRAGGWQLDGGRVPPTQDREQTFYRCKAKYGGMSESDAQKLNTPENVNRRLKSYWRSRCWTSALKDLLAKS